MSLRPGDRPRRFPGFPRVSGDEPVAELVLHIGIEFSPRERG